MDALGSVAGLLGLVVSIVGIWLAVRHHKRSVALLQTICTGLRLKGGN
jgi:hypothetical protein